MNRERTRAAVACALRIFLGCMFLYTGLIHALDPKGFAVAVANYRILPEALVNLFAVTLPFIELIAGASLILGVFVPGCSLIVGGLLLVFSLALSMALVRGLDISCGCFSLSEEAEKISWLYLARDLGLLAMAMFVFLFDTGMGSIEKVIGQKPRG